MKKNLTDKQKLEALIAHYANNDKGAFAEMLGLPRSTVTTWLFRGAMTAKGRELVLDTFADLNRDWLLRDDPHMQKPEEDTVEVAREDMVPYYEDLEGTCGVSEQFENPEYANDRIYVPGMHGIAAIPATGDSMEPTICQGDTVIIGEPVSLDSTHRSNIYLICTREGQRMFKRLEADTTSQRHILALSDNLDYTPRVFRLDRRSVLAVYPVNGIVRHL